MAINPLQTAPVIDKKSVIGISVALPRTQTVIKNALIQTPTKYLWSFNLEAITFAPRIESVIGNITYGMVIKIATP